jgi:N-acetyl-gamma-glutamyl-phosphate reductase
MIKVGIVGATGYTGEELVRILLDHPEVEITSLTAKLDKEQKFSEIFGKFKGKCDLPCKNLDVDEVAKKTDLVFLALPHGVSCQFAGKFLQKKKKVIDLSADYRLKNVLLYKKWYNLDHPDKENIKNSVYGLPEIYKDKIKDATLIANPGCYPTASILTCLPVIKSDDIKVLSIIIDAKTGLTGAGRRASLATSYSEINENAKAYKINEHQHTPEINQELSYSANENIEVVFTPHLIPLDRGILTTCYIQCKQTPDTSTVVKLYKDFYKDDPFVKVLDKGQLPQLKDVAYSNYCHLGLAVNKQKNIIIVVGAIDNLGKGASGQAVENMNIMSGFSQEEGLI